MLEVVRKHEEIMQERFEEKYWFWITTAEEYIENMKSELDEEDFENLMEKLNEYEYEYDKDDYILDRYNGLDISFHSTLKDAYFSGIDHGFGKHIYEEVLKELDVDEEG